ncbi:hypothetical protein BN946_scf184996.g24 [Trametes cinnabarina]|uniref:NADH:ubiquinone reductase (non-electrogenic) n=1 Tax=Pycnoporus cinnabarinus TaxID=5643 RepID=A0A060S881_PYCCI|nr:hypothetical protein BN946_scf184996.g24 [Trametes cinnabarina]
MLAVQRTVAAGARRSGGTRSLFSSASQGKQRLVILGSGWGGYEILRAIDKKRWNVIVVSPSNYFNFTPLLASCSVGTLEFRAAVEPVRRYTPDVMPATAPVKLPESGHPTERSDVNESASSVKGSTEKFQLTYDKLVIAVGAYSQSTATYYLVRSAADARDCAAFNVPGVKEHAHFLKDIRDARAIRTRILDCFEQANQPTITDADRRKLLNFCIVGGGPTGVEFAAELHDFLHTDLARHYPVLARMAKINLYDVAPVILGGFDTGLQEYVSFSVVYHNKASLALLTTPVSNRYATSKFKREGIRLLTQHHVERVEAGRMFVTEEGEVDFGLLVWSTGLAPNPLIQSITEAKKDERTKRSLVTNGNLNVIMKDTGAPDSDVFAIGDAALIQDQPLPATAQVANQQAKYLTRQLNRLVRSGRVDDAPFKFQNMGSLAYVGDWEAIFDRTKVERGPKGKETGRLAWLLWRSAYFTKTLSVRNKILVPMYWFLNWIFGRDLSRF